MRTLVALVIGALVTCWIGLAEARDDFGLTVDQAKRIVKELTDDELRSRGCKPGLAHPGQDCEFAGRGPGKYLIAWEFEVSPEGKVAGAMIQFFHDQGMDLGKPEDDRFPLKAILALIGVAAGGDDISPLANYVLAIFNNEVLPPKPPGLMISTFFLGDRFQISVKTPYIGSSSRGSGERSRR
ncbi:hypothetical protein [Methylocella sp. CPCC 101449]|uniref:hypothetical protein n=1 Tax=Methylocella sp. CPCC 101449 TaxID=2987531 RepID=UPI002890E29C|nr:hypothetical protein [Methylocella sp. CPCC 101449]MDT2023029.1 hypothetical protein [Methylocella sp. CPCC 101449]